MDTASELGRCRESAGFLVAHPCRNPAAARCTDCAKPICADHTRDGKCIACFRKSPVRDADDPYRMGAFYYSDFEAISEYDAYTKKDREAFAAAEEAWEPAWETDFDGS